MSKVLVTESSLESIANAIRSKNGLQTTYKPSQMAEAIAEIPTGTTPSGTIDITQNGTVDVTNYASADVAVPNSYASGDEGKVVSNGALVAQTARASEITANGTYDTTLNDEVTVNVSGGGGGGSIPSFQQDTILYLQPNTNDNTKGYAAIAKELLMSSDNPFIGSSDVKAQISYTDFVSSIKTGMFAGYEYYNYVDANFISATGIVLLGDFSLGGDASGNVLLDSIQNYSAILLQGVYYQNATSQYNTTKAYAGVELDTAYWAGMKDRNKRYTCNVTFTDNTHCNLSGNKQVIIYGLL